MDSLATPRIDAVPHDLDRAARSGIERTSDMPFPGGRGEACLPVLQSLGTALGEGLEVPVAGHRAGKDQP
jgi:hypothetical protein